MKKLTIGFSTPIKSTIFSDIIKKGENTPFSHVYIKFKIDDIDREVIYQASGLVVNFQNTNIFYGKETIIKEFELDISDETLIKIHQFAVDNVGIPYSMGDIFGLALKILVGKIGFKIKNPYKNDKRGYVCSKLVAYILKEDLGLNIVDPNSMDPYDVYLFLDNMKSGAQ